MRLKRFRNRKFSSAAITKVVLMRPQSPWVRASALLLGLLLVLTAGVWLYERYTLRSPEGHFLRDQAAGLEAQVAQLQDELAVQRMLQSRNEQNGVSYALTLANESTIEALGRQVRELQAENQSLRDDLGFYENLLPVDGSGAVAIRSMQVDKSVLSPQAAALKWQVLVMQPRRDAVTFTGKLEVFVTGTQNGKEWHSAQSSHEESMEFSRFLRVEGVLSIPMNVQVQSVTARVRSGSTVLAQQAVVLRE